jgi:hypothetical protein
VTRAPPANPGLLVLAAVATTVAACGGNDEHAAAAATTASDTTTAAADQRWKKVIHGRDCADRAFFRDGLELRFEDAGNGWLIFALPPAELAAHPADENGRHELYLMCDDIKATVAELSVRGAEIARPVTDEGSVA